MELLGATVATMVGMPAARIRRVRTRVLAVAPIRRPQPTAQVAATDRLRRTRAEAQRLRIRLPATRVVADTARQAVEAAAIALPAVVADTTAVAVAVVRTPAAEVADIANRETRILTRAACLGRPFSVRCGHAVSDR